MITVRIVNLKILQSLRSHVSENTLPVVHHKQLQVRYIVDYKLLELVGKVVPCLLVRTITNVGH
jgi:hypothetical protein